MKYRYLFVALAEIFAEAIDALYDNDGSGLPLDEKHPKVLAVSEKLCITPQQVFERYIDPYAKPGMDTETLHMIASLQSSKSKYSDVPCIFEVTPLDRFKTYTEIRWLLVQVHDLNIPGVAFDDNPKGTRLYLKDREIMFGCYRLPHNTQCIYCGRLDEDEQGNRFDNKRKLCHAKGCEARSEPNPEEHPNCCFGKWRREKKAFNRWLNRAELRGESQKAITAYFKRFCAARLESIAQHSPPHPKVSSFHRFHWYPKGWFEPNQNFVKFLKEHQCFPETGEPL
jgi:hypothetical protein